MLKKLGIVTSSSDVGNEYKRQLLEIFNHGIDIVTYSFDMNNKESVGNVDALLISTYSQYEVLKKYIDTDVEVVISRLTLSKKGYNILKKNNMEKKAALVNLNFEMCIETIAILYQLGFDDYELIPVYPNMESIPDLPYAITTGECDHVPVTIEAVLDLGHRVIDKNTIVDLAIALNLEDVLNEKRILGYFKTMASYNKGYEYFISQSKTSKNQFNTLLSIMDKGVLSFNHKGIIETYNEQAQKLIGLPLNFVGRHINELIPKTIIEHYLESKVELLNKLVIINDHHITVSIVPIGDRYTDGKADAINGSYAILESFENQEATQNKLRLQLSDKGHVAKYSVDHIIGDSDAVNHVRELVLRMGNSHSVVLITGESGTGKELIAQAIHNASPRQHKQFIAINCAALSANLLESELFGYESGAFTGASKNGKAGIFELAHNGTLFLDEIGEMPLELQVRLLRVIQEKEVMRVGGNKLIKVDVRIVAATNRDLYSQVKNGDFRKDLYYRLNVLPINVPPLRERGKDIVLLMDYFKDKGGCCYEFSKEVINFLEGYDWEGNIRELRNSIEYFDNIGTSSITLDQLPYHMQQTLKMPSNSKQLCIEGLEEKENYVLDQLYRAFKEKKKLGRKSLSDKAHQEGIFLSEYDIRGIFTTFKTLGYINTSSGRGGSTISPLGIQVIESHK